MSLIPLVQISQATSEQGAKLYLKINALLKKSQQVVLDFQGIGLTSSSFFNGALVDIYKDGLHIELRNLSARDRCVLNHTMKAALHGGEVATV